MGREERWQTHSTGDLASTSCQSGAEAWPLQSTPRGGDRASLATGPCCSYLRSQLRFMPSCLDSMIPQALTRGTRSSGRQRGAKADYGPPVALFLATQQRSRHNLGAERCGGTQGSLPDLRDTLSEHIGSSGSVRTFAITFYLKDKNMRGLPEVHGKMELKA